MTLPTMDDHAAPCRPTVSCTADITTPGTLEVEVGFAAARTQTQLTDSAPFLIKQTISSLLQLQLGSNGYTSVSGNTPAQYFDNVLVGLKFHLLDQKRATPSLALTATVGVPTFEATGYTRMVDAFVTGHASKDLGPIHADLNLGVAAFGIDGTPVSQGLFAFALSTSLQPPFGVALEVYALTDSGPVAPRDGGVRMAISVTPKPWLVFDFGGDVGFFPSTRAFSAFFGMTVIPIVFRK